MNQTHLTTSQASPTLIPEISSRSTPPITLPRPGASILNEPPAMLPQRPPTTLRGQTEAMISQLDRKAHENPGKAILTMFGLGLAVGAASCLLGRSHESPPQRAKRSLRNLGESLVEMAIPAKQRAAEVAEHGTQAVRRSLHSAADSKFLQRLCHILKKAES
jgi:hypothetical protein